MKKKIFLKTFFAKSAVLILVLFLFNCQDRDDILLEDNHEATQIHKEKIRDYWSQLKNGSSTEQFSEIDELAQVTDVSNLKIYDLRTTEKLLIADIGFLEGLEGIVKIIFYLNENKVVRSNLVTLKSDKFDSNYNKVILSILNADKKDFNYSGEVTFLSLSKIKIRYNKYDQGKLIENVTLSAARNNSSTSKTQASCVEYWWVTRYGDEIISQVLLFIICDCSGGGGGGGGGGEESSKIMNCNGGTNIFLGGSGASSTTSYKPTLPPYPVNNQTYKFTDPDGVCTEYIFKTSTNSWQILQVMLPNMIISNNRDNYGILEFQWPVNNQKVFDPSTNIIYTYEQGSDSWIGVPSTDQLLAETTVEKIDDSLLDPCPKGALNKL